jgi:protein-disulfide isomerase|tara:strand:+ start:475 stop:1062 length:588 start_codon:yes stop_codon:yes gene_type:complete
MKKIIISFIFLLFPTANISADSLDETKRIVAGNKNAKITIITYESLTCSHCADFHINIYPELKRDYIDSGIAKIEFRHFPLDVAAFNASKISQCKKDEGLEILESLYSNQSKWVKGQTIEEVNENLKKFLKSQKFNLNFDDCITNKNIEDFVLNDRIEGVKKFKVNATPTIIINDQKFEKSLNYKNLKKTLEKLI